MVAAAEENVEQATSEPPIPENISENELQSQVEKPVESAPTVAMDSIETEVEEVTANEKDSFENVEQVTSDPPTAETVSRDTVTSTEIAQSENGVQENVEALKPDDNSTEKITIKSSDFEGVPIKTEPPTTDDEKSQISLLKTEETETDTDTEIFNQFKIKEEPIENCRRVGRSRKARTQSNSMNSDQGLSKPIVIKSEGSKKRTAAASTQDLRLMYPNPPKRARGRPRKSLPNSARTCTDDSNSEDIPPAKKRKLAAEVWEVVSDDEKPLSIRIKRVPENRNLKAANKRNAKPVQEPESGPKKGPIVLEKTLFVRLVKLKPSELKLMLGRSDEGANTAPKQ